MLERRGEHRLLLGEVRDVARDGDRVVRAAELLGEGVELVLRARGEHEAIAGLRGAAGGLRRRCRSTRL